MIPTNSHLFAVLVGCNTAQELAELLPECDISDQIIMVLETQCQIIMDIVNNRHFGDDALDDFVETMKAMRHEIKKINAEKRG